MFLEIPLLSLIIWLPIILGCFILIFKNNKTGSLFVKNILPLYYGSIQNGIQSGNWAEATQNLSYIKTFQQKFGSEVFPSTTKFTKRFYIFCVSHNQYL